MAIPTVLVLKLALDITVCQVHLHTRKKSHGSGIDLGLEFALGVAMCKVSSAANSNLHCWRSLLPTRCPVDSRTISYV